LRFTPVRTLCRAGGLFHHPDLADVFHRYDPSVNRYFP
jgi:hypothetical protein